MSNTSNSIKAIIPGRLSYASIWEPSVSMGGGDPKYRTAVLVPKSDTKTVDLIKASIEKAKQIGAVKKWGGKIPGNLKLPLHDGDIERPDDPNYKGMYYFNCSSEDAPQIVDRNVQTITDPMQVYSGCYCNVSVTFYAFNRNGSRGVAVGLGNIQLIRDGERLSGKASAASEFTPVEDESGFVPVDDIGDIPDYLK
jgi:hypothetical protein